MVRKRALLSGLLLAGHAAAGAHHALFPRTHDVGHVLQRDSNDLMATLTRRQQEDDDSDDDEEEDDEDDDDEPQASNTPALGAEAMPDRAQWEADTQAACNGAITALNGQASNPTGLAVCYNLPFLNNQTGVFIAELRLYKVTDPIAPWTGVNVRDINMALSYPGAAVQNVQGSLNKRDLLEARQNANDVTPEQLKVLMYVGRINSNAMGTAMAQAEIQRLLIPQIELSANSPSGQPLTAALSSSDASFLNGVFATTGTVNTDDPAAAASATAAAQAAQPFELPGTRLAFFPVGLVITSVWTAIFFLAVGLGTFGRLQFREQYRRRIKREMANGVRTI